MFLTSVPLHWAHKERTVKCKEGMAMCEDASTPKAGPAAGHVAVTSGVVGLLLTNSGTILYNIKCI